MQGPKFKVFAEGYWKTRSVVNRESVSLDFVPVPMASCTKLATAKRLTRKLQVVAVVFADGKLVHEHVPTESTEQQLTDCPEPKHGESCFCSSCL